MNLERKLGIAIGALEIIQQWFIQNQGPAYGYVTRIGAILAMLKDE